MKNRALLALAATVLLTAGYYGLYAAYLAGTADYYYGRITQEPKVGKTGEREISLLSAGEAEAETLTVSEFCAIPYTQYCNTDNANLHGTFERGASYCVEASGWRNGWLSLKPNVMRIVKKNDGDYSGCVEVGAPEQNMVLNAD